MTRAEYACRDGSPFPVEFAEPGDLALRWKIDREHSPTAMTPLAGQVGRLGRRGAERAYEESGLRMPSPLLHDPPLANGYEYCLDFRLPPAEEDELEAGLARLARQHGGTPGVWSGHCLPRVERACAWLEAAPPGTPFAALAERRGYAWSLTGVAGVAAGRDLRAVAAMCRPLFGDRATLIAHALAQGSDNETIAADRAVRRIAHLEPGSSEAASARAEFLAAYGSRAVSWSIDHPTLREQPELLDAQLRLLRGQSTNDLDDVERRAADRRRRLAATIVARLADDERRTTFERRLERLASFVPVREARARWQLVASGAVRQAVREHGRRLVERGSIDAVDDVFFLTPDEYDAQVGPGRTEVAVRRARHERWMAITPPTGIGGTGPDPATSPAGELRGAPGAPGVVRGPARVILDLADADRLEVGDVLVTTMTAPPWTPLFGVAAAVVTDSGDALSHVAIAAREYGIPCVVGTDLATVLVDDGASVTVDGDAGTVGLPSDR